MISSISFILPLYNAEEYIQKCVLSCLQQSSENLSVEVIVIDDGSSDRGADIVKTLAKSYSNLKYYYQSNQGVSAARNLGIQVASSDFVMFIDADDYLDTYSIPEIVCYMVKNNIDIIAHGAIVESDDKPIYLNNQPAAKIGSAFNGLDFIRNNNGPYKKGAVSGAWGFIIRKASITDNNVNTLFLLELLPYTKNVCWTNRQFYHYVQHTGSVMHSHYDMEYLAKVSLKRCFEKKRIMANPCILADKEVSEIIENRMIAIAFSRVILMMLRRNTQYKQAKSIISLFEQNGFYPLPRPSKRFSPYGIGYKRLIYTLLNKKAIYYTCLRIRNLINNGKTKN
jgi:glycosyltransferase involved in cell wall biosynthesis